MKVIARDEYRESNCISGAPQPPGVYRGKTQLAFSHSLESAPQLTMSIVGATSEDLRFFRERYFHGAQYLLNGVNYEVISYSDTKETLPETTKKKYGIDPKFDVTIEMESSNQTLYERTAKLRPLVFPRSRRRNRDDEGLMSLSALALKVKATLLFPDFEAIVNGTPSSGDVVALADFLPEVARIRGRYVDLSNPEGIGLIDVDSSPIWQVIPEQVIDEGTATSEIPPALIDYEITGDFSNFPDDENDDESLIMEQPTIDEETEGDEDPHLPPADSFELIDITSNADISGPTKQFERVVSINGAIALRERFVYGFAYTGEDVHFAGGTIFESEPEKWWKIIDYKQETYQYERLRGGITLSFNLFEPGSQAFRVPIYVDPDLPTDGTVELVGERQVRIQPRTEYLIEVLGAGYLWTRFRKETDIELPETIVATVFDPGSLANPIDLANYNLFKFFFLPVQSRTTYLLETERAHYLDNIAEPFTYEIIKASDVAVGRRNRLGIQRTSPNGFIAIATPAQNFTENMLIMKEGYDERAFEFAPNPENVEGEPILDGYIVGKEVIQRTERKVTIPKNRTYKPPRTNDKYTERRSDYTSSDPGFDASLTLVTKGTKVGRPPTASTRSFEFDLREKRRSRRNSARYRYFVSSDRVNFRTKIGGSESVAQARTYNEGQNAVLTALNLAHWESQQQTKKLTWYYPQMRAGHRILIDNQLYVILDVSYNLDYTKTKIRSALNGQTFKTDPALCDGMELTLGLYEKRELFTTRRPDDEYEGPPNDEEDNTFTYNGSRAQLGSNPIEMKSRRQRVPASP